MQTLLFAVSAHQAGDIDKAEKLYHQVLTNDPSNADALHYLGLIEASRGQIDQAIIWMTRAIEVKADLAPAYNNRGNCFKILGKFTEALADFDKALRYAPHFAAAFTNRGACHYELGAHEKAIIDCTSALRIDPTSSDAFNNRGNALHRIGRDEQAIEDFSRAISLNPGDHVVYVNRANVLKELGRFSEASSDYATASRLSPGYADALFGQSLLDLLNGHFSRGWEGYETRPDRDRLMPSEVSNLPQLRSLNEAEQKRVLVYSEQGLGDTIQFCRYLPLLREAGALVYFAPQKPLLKLVSTLTDQVELVGGDLESSTFDFQISLLSLPRLFSTQLNQVPAKTPYLQADPSRVDNWAKIIGSLGFRIGICWQGSTSNADLGRSFPVSMFQGIAANPDVRLISLHKGAGEDQLEQWPGANQIETLGREFDSENQAFLDTAAVMQSLDLIISCDTAVAHLAGALGVRTWVALKAVPDWRWLMQRQDTPWYPTMRLFRQQRKGDWKGVFDHIQEALTELLAAR